MAGVVADRMRLVCPLVFFCIATVDKSILIICRVEYTIVHMAMPDGELADMEQGTAFICVSSDKHTVTHMTKSGQLNIYDTEDAAIKHASAFNVEHAAKKGWMLKVVPVTYFYPKKL